MLAYAISKLKYSQHHSVIQPLPYYDNTRILTEHNSPQNTPTQTLNNKPSGLCSSPPGFLPPLRSKRRYTHSPGKSEQKLNRGRYRRTYVHIVDGHNHSILMVGFQDVQNWFNISSNYPAGPCTVILLTIHVRSNIATASL